MSISDALLMVGALDDGCMFEVPLVMTPSFRWAVLSAIRACRN